jgi:hypothetical protein
METRIMSESLFSLVAQANALEQKIAEAGGEISPEVEKELSHIDLALPDKIDSYAFIIGRLDAASDYWKAKAAEYTKLAKSTANASERIRGAIKQAMMAMQRDEVSGGDIRFKLTSSKASLVIDGATLDPSYMMTVTNHVADKERIKSALEAGFPVKGAHLEAGKALRTYPVKKA